nr:hypothetical protein GCM10020092_072840 [Actinoplanes digitatis]
MLNIGDTAPRGDLDTPFPNTWRHDVPDSTGHSRSRLGAPRRAGTGARRRRRHLGAGGPSRSAPPTSPSPRTAARSPRRSGTRPRRPSANKPVAAGDFGVVAFGHGFLQGVAKYTSTLNHLASWGYIVAAPTSQGGLSANHSAFADDLNATLTWFVAQDTTTGSRFAGHVDPAALGLSGHSMGAGASILAAARNPQVRAVGNLAAAETNPSAVTAAATLRTPAMLVSGDRDTIAPPTDHQVPIYQAKAGPKQLRTVVGGSHCGFMDSSGLFCDSATIDRATQLKLTRRLLTDWFRYTLSGDTARYDAVWGTTAQNDPQVRFQGVS